MAGERPLDLWHGISIEPHQMGAGGEHVIFDRGGGMVAKINTHLLRKVLTGAFTEDTIQQEIVKRREGYAALKRSFGEAHVLWEECDLMEIALSVEDCELLAPGSGFERIQFCPTIITHQALLPELEQNNPGGRRVVSIGDGKYAEERVSAKDFAKYEAASNHLVLGIEENTDISYRRQNWAPDSWQSIGHHWHTPAMGQLATGFSRFADETSIAGEGGVALDMTGLYNVVFYPQTVEQEADFKLVDALYPAPALTMQAISSLLLRLNEEETPNLSPGDKAKLTNGVNYLRNANGIIEFGGPWPMAPFINPFPQDVAWQPDIWRRVYAVSREWLHSLGRTASAPAVL